MTAPRTTLECHLAEVCLEDCTCPHEWKGLGILYGISMGDGWVRMTDAEECPVHGGSCSGVSAAMPPKPGRRSNRSSKSSTSLRSVKP